MSGSSASTASSAAVFAGGIGWAMAAGRNSKDNHSSFIELIVSHAEQIT
jgi:hypothetical protein